MIHEFSYENSVRELANPAIGKCSIAKGVEHRRVDRWRAALERNDGFS